MREHPYTTDEESRRSNAWDYARYILTILISIGIGVMLAWRG